MSLVARRDKRDFILRDSTRSNVLFVDSVPQDAFVHEVNQCAAIAAHPDRLLPATLGDEHLHGDTRNQVLMIGVGELLQRIVVMRDRTGALCRRRVVITI